MRIVVGGYKSYGTKTHRTEGISQPGEMMQRNNTAALRFKKTLLFDMIQQFLLSQTWHNQPSLGFES